MDGTPSPELAKKAKEKPWFSVCVTKDNSYVLDGKRKTGAPPARILMPWVDATDPRFFVRNGELIKPHGIVEFSFVRMEQCPELDHDRACYKELIRSEFDSSGCVPIKYFDLEKYSESLNGAQQMAERLLPDAPAEGNA